MHDYTLKSNSDYFAQRYNQQAKQAHLAQQARQGQPNWFRRFNFKLSTNQSHSLGEAALKTR